MDKEEKIKEVMKMVLGLPNHDFNVFYRVIVAGSAKVETSDKYAPTHRRSSYTERQ